MDLLPKPPASGGLMKKAGHVAKDATNLAYGLGLVGLVGVGLVYVYGTAKRKIAERGSAPNGTGSPFPGAL